MTRVKVTPRITPADLQYDWIELYLTPATPLDMAIELAAPLIVDLPDTAFPSLTAWYPILPSTTFPLPTRDGNTLLMVTLHVHLTWTAGNNSQAICDWSINSGTTFQRSFHMIVDRQDDSTVNGIDSIFWVTVSGTAPTVQVVGREAVGPLGMAVVGANNATWPALGSKVLILDMGPV